MRHSERADPTPYLTISLDGHWHVVDPHDGRTRELIGADGLDLSEVQARIGELYAETFASHNPAQCRLL